MISSIFYNGDGSTRIFPVTFKINGEDYVRVYVDNVEVIDRTKYDIINNSIVFAPDDIPAVGTDNIKIYVATSASELGDLGAPLTDITNVANNLAEIVAVSTQVVPNLPEILLADNNATIATTQANLAIAAMNAAEVSEANAAASATTATSQALIATTKASDASDSAASAASNAAIATNRAIIATDEAIISTTKASEASASATNASNSATNASNSATNASNSATTATNQATIATTKASEASASATSASSSAASATTKASEANASAISASNSATSASNSATTSTTKANEASASASLASASANNANTSETMAYKWSSNPVDTIVETDKYSALHWATKAQQWASTVDTTNFVDRTTNQSIGGIKTFTSSPIVPTPTTDFQSATKKYVDDNKTTVVSASQTAQGIIEIATDAEVQAGTDTTRAVTPAGLKAGLNATDTAPIYACRAWVNFNGTDTVAIRASGNVSSITDNGVGIYTVNFTTPMIDANYCANYSAAAAIGNENRIIASLTTTSLVCKLSKDTAPGEFRDTAINCVSVFR